MEERNAKEKYYLRISSQLLSMKKPDPLIQNALQNKREKKRLKRLRKSIIYRGKMSVYEKIQNFQVVHDKRIINQFQSKVYKFLLDKNFITGTESRDRKILFPKIFSLCDNYSESVQSIRNMVFAIWKNAGQTIELDFSKCTKVDQSALFLLQILRLEILGELIKLEKGLKILSARVKFDIEKSAEQSVNFNLFLCGFLSNVEATNDMIPIDTIGYIKGTKSQKSYLENRKGVIGTKIVTYFDKCLRNNLYTLTPKGKNELGNMIGEILNNAEDHSPTNTYYVTANYYIDKGTASNENDAVGVLNLSFMNFGYSIFEGLEQTKLENFETYDFLEGVYEQCGTKKFSKENMFTLLALQDGVSRLKFEDKSRGTGTMTFINCFYEIGDYQNLERSLLPQLSILSGTTQLICNNSYRPFSDDKGNYFLSLNRDNDLTKPPDPKNLMDVKHGFPGTILSVRFCLSRGHIQKKMNNGTGN